MSRAVPFYDWQDEVEDTASVTLPRVVAEYLLTHLTRDTAPLHPTAHDDAVTALRQVLRKRWTDWAPPHGMPRPRGVR